MVTDRWEELQQLVAAGQVDELVERCVGLSEAERRAVSKRAAKAHLDRWSAYNREIPMAERDQVVWATELLAAGTGGPAAVAGRTWGTWRGSEQFERLVRARPREWRDEWAERAVEQPDAFGNAVWPMVHRLVAEGECAKPAGDGYVTGALRGLRERAIWYQPRRRRLGEVLRDEPEFVDSDMWRLFEIEGRGEVSFTSADSTSAWTEGDDTWTEALVALSAEGMIPRERLLDETLAALRRDFSPYCARWFHKTHEALEPTLEERAARSADYRALLAAPDPAVVGFAVRALVVLARAKRLDGDALFEHLGPAVLVPTKATAVRALKLGGRTLKAQPQLAAIALPVFVEALVHEAREVQEAAIELLERHRGALTPDLGERIAELVSTTDPALRGRFASLAGEEPSSVDPSESEGSEPPAPRDEEVQVSVPGALEMTPDRPRLRDADRLTPIADVEELADRLAVAIERGDDPDGLELIVDAASRLCDQLPDEGRAQALRSRVNSKFGGYSGEVHLEYTGTPSFAALLADQWLDATPERRLVTEPGLGIESLTQRLIRVLGDIRARRPRSRLAAPTHRGGWIDAATAATRIARLSEDPDGLDLAQCLLRLAPERHDEALDAILNIHGEAAAALRHALGAKERKPLRPRLGPAWEAARQVQAPTRFEASRVDFNRTYADGCRHRDRKRRRPASPATLLQSTTPQWTDRTYVERWLATVFPSNKQPFYTIGSERLILFPDGVLHGAEDFIAPLLDPDEPIPATARTLLALGLGTSHAAIRAITTDTIIEAIATNRIDGEQLGEALLDVLQRHERVVPSRWSPRLVDISRTSAIHAQRTQDAIEIVLSGATDKDQRRLAGLVELLRLIAVEADARVRDPCARLFLEAIPPRSKTGRTAQEALAVTGQGTARSRDAARALTRSQ